MDSLEAVIAVYIVRFGVVLAALGLGIANWVRTSRLQREKFSIPDDLSANVNRLLHEVKSVDESLHAHVGKEEARVFRAEKKEAQRIADESDRATAAASIAAAAPVPYDGSVPTATAAQVKLGLTRALAESSQKRRTRRLA